LSPHEGIFLILGGLCCDLVMHDSQTANISIKQKLQSSDQQELVNQKQLKMEVKVKAHTRVAIKDLD
jgi:hypothetical protein